MKTRVARLEIVDLIDQGYGEQPKENKLYDKAVEFPNAFIFDSNAINEMVDDAHLRLYLMDRDQEGEQ